MSALAGQLSEARASRARTKPSLVAEIHTDLSGVEALWRGLETDPDGLATPYQRFDWVAAFLAATGPEQRAARLRVVVLRDASGDARMLLPLWIERVRGIRVAGVVGEKHANFHMPLFAARDAAALPFETIADALVQAGRQSGIDVFALTHQPRFWHGVPNPLATGGQPCASDAYGLLLGPDAESTVKRVFSVDARKKLRNKERRLIELCGPLTHRVAADGAQAAAILTAFYAQKSVRFAGQGINNPYAQPAIQAFLAAATERVGDRVPAVELHALEGADGRVLATFAGAVDAVRFSGMCTSFDGDPEIGRYSPGDLLLNRLVGDQAARGRRAFDLGVGEARYKSSVCDEAIALVETLLPVSGRGRMFAHAVAGVGRLKRRIKRSPRLWALAQRLRRLRRTA